MNNNADAINAYDARKQTETHQYNGIPKSIFDKIHATANKGESVVYINDKFVNTKQIMDSLENLGYQVTAMLGNAIRVTW